MSPSPPTPAPAELARAARAASRTLQALPSEARVAALHRVADALLARKDEILAAGAIPKFKKSAHHSADEEAASGTDARQRSKASRTP